MLGTWFRGLAQLRHPELLRFLGEKRRELRLLQTVRERFPQAKVTDGVLLVGYDHDRLALGARSTVATGTILAFGDDQNGFGRIAIGENSWVGQYNNLRACEGGDIAIGNHCLISQFCSLVGSNHATRRDRPIREQGPDSRRLGATLDDDVWLGAGVAVMPGVTIGRGAVVGANAVVSKDIPAYETWAGVPARRIGQRA